MKIAYLVNQYPSVSHSFIRREIQALERRGVAVLRWAIRPSKESFLSPEDAAEAEKTHFLVTAAKPALAGDILAQVIAAPGRSVRNFWRAMKFGWRSEAGLFKHVLYYLEALAIARWAARDGVRHIHAHFGTNGAMVAMLAADLAKISFSMTVHGPEEFEKPSLISLREKIEAAAFTVGISKFGVSQLKKLTKPIHWKKITPVHCGLEPSFHQNADGPAPAEKHFVCVGRLCAEKGQIDLVEAAGRIAARHPDFRLTLIGDGPMRPEIEAAVARLGISEQVALAGWKTPCEVRAALLAARCFILPSYAEGLPVSIMEALALRRPVISTYVAGIPELVTADCGWVTPAGDVDAIADAMAAAADASPDDLARMGEIGRNRALKAHDIDKEAEKLAALFTDFIGAAR